MKLNDVLWGLLCLAAGAAIALQARTFPTMPGQRIGPGLFPTLVGVGFAACGIALVIAGQRRREGGWFRLDDWVRRPRMAAHFALIVAVLVFYALVVDHLGFFLTALIVLSVLFAAFRVPRIQILPIAVVVTLVIHYCFYTLLRVPLPWGLLEGIAW